MENNLGRTELSLWSANMIFACLLLFASVVVDFSASVDAISTNGANKDISGFLGLGIITLILFIPPFVITEELESCRKTYASLPLLRPLYAFSLTYLAIITLMQITFIAFESKFAVILALIAGRLAMCFLYRKYPMDKINA